jgi:hypothetical protein
VITRSIQTSRIIWGISWQARLLTGAANLSTPKATAADCRRLAAAGEEEHIRFQLLAVTEHFERLAEQQVPISAKPPPKS